MTSRIEVRMTAAFDEALRAYQKAQGYASPSEALLHLAALGYERETGCPAPNPHPPKRGGWRGREASLRALMKRADEVTDMGRNDPEEGELS